MLNGTVGTFVQGYSTCSDNAVEVVENAIHMYHKIHGTKDTVDVADVRACLVQSASGQIVKVRHFNELLMDVSMIIGDSKSHVCSKRELREVVLKIIGVVF